MNNSHTGVIVNTGIVVSPVGTKDTDFIDQRSKVYAAFSHGAKTMLEVAEATNVLRANICRYVAEWKEQNRIYFVGYGLCSMSHHRAGFYTTKGKETNNV